MERTISTTTIIDMMGDEIEALRRTLNVCSPYIVSAVEILRRSFGQHGRFFTTGAGASGLVAKEIAGQALELGFFCYPLTNDLAEAQPVSFTKGSYEVELGLAGYYAFLMNPEDVLIAVSASGETGFVCELANIAKGHYEVKVISITENPDSRLAKCSDIVIPTKGKPELPSATKTQTCALVVGHALMMGLAEVCGVTEKDMLRNMEPEPIETKPMGWK